MCRAHLVRLNPPGTAVVLAAVAVLIATSKGAAFRTASELPELAGASSPVRWEQYEIPFLMDTEGTELTSGQLVVSSQLAFQAWTREPCLERMVSVSTGRPLAPASGDGINSISFSRRAGELDPGLAGRTELVYEQQGERWSIVEADIVLDSGLLTISAGTDGPSFESALAHELGHALGLLHSCGENGAPPCADAPSTSIMSASFADSAPTLNEDDRAGICYLYAGTNPSSPPRDDSGTDRPPNPDSSPWLRLGDPCDPGEALCVDGDCSFSSSTCERSCARAQDCPGAATCIDGSCAGGPLGASCERGAECASATCLVRPSGGVCTRRCMEGQSLGTTGACPDPFVCAPRQTATGASLCMIPDAEGGCTAGGGKHSQPWVLLTLLVVVSRRRHQHASIKI